jgi:hypothetical protein
MKSPLQSPTQKQCSQNTVAEKMHAMRAQNQAIKMAGNTISNLNSGIDIRMLRRYCLKEFGGCVVEDLYKRIR